MKLSLFRKEPLDCDYVYQIVGKTFGFIDCDKHVTALVKNQEKINGVAGAWSEFFNFKKGNEAPQTTAESILALLPYKHRSEVEEAIKKACQYLITSQQNDGGWKDLVGYSVVDATGCAIIALSELKRMSISDIPPQLFEKAIKFLISQQNADGGWCTAFNQDDSKMHYTFFALWGLYCGRTIIQDKVGVDNTILKGIKWIKQNSSKHNDIGLSNSLKNNAPDPTATSLSILCFLNIGKKNQIKTQWLKFLKDSSKNGTWESGSDTSIVYGQRRTYDFQSLPWIIECLVRNGEKIDSDVIKKALSKLSESEYRDGGLVIAPGDTNPAVWLTSWTLIMMDYLNRELRSNLREYVDNIIANKTDLEQKVKRLEKEKKPKHQTVNVLSVFSAVLIVSLTSVLYFNAYQKIVWFTFFSACATLLAIAVAYYWRSEKQLNDYILFVVGAILALLIAVIGFFA